MQHKAALLNIYCLSAETVIKTFIYNKTSYIQIFSTDRDSIFTIRFTILPPQCGFFIQIIKDRWRENPTVQSDPNDCDGVGDDDENEDGNKDEDGGGDNDGGEKLI